MAKQRKYDRIKEIKRNSRETQSQHGKSGVHVDKKDKRQKEKTTQDYIDETKEEDDD